MKEDMLGENEDQHPRRRRKELNTKKGKSQRVGSWDGEVEGCGRREEGREKRGVWVLGRPRVRYGTRLVR